MKGKRKRAANPGKTIQEATKEAMAHAALDQGKPLAQVAQEHGLKSDMVVRFAVAEELGRRKAEAQITPDMLAMSARQKLEAAIRQHKRKLDLEFEQRCSAECQRWLNDVSLPQYTKEITELERSISSRRGVMDRATYRKILSCLHPDRVDATLKKRYEEAFRLFTELEKRVLNEKESPTAFRQMPRTYEELMAMKAKVQAERRAKRSASKVRVYGNG